MSLSDDAATGWLWSANSGWISLSCENTDSCATVDYGVMNDGAGQLSGYAWSPNLGWISFSCVDSASCDNVDYGVGSRPDKRPDERLGLGCQRRLDQFFPVLIPTAVEMWISASGWPRSWSADPIFSDRFQ